MTTEEKLRYVAVFLADRTADASWLLIKRSDYMQLPSMAVKLEDIGGKMPHAFDWDVLIDRMYDYVLELEGE